MGRTIHIDTLFATLSLLSGEQMARRSGNAKKLRKRRGKPSLSPRHVRSSAAKAQAPRKPPKQSEKKRATAVENRRLLKELRQRNDELSDSLEQQNAMTEVLNLVSRSQGALEPVFYAILQNATRICDAKFGILFLADGDAFRTVAMHNAPAALVEQRQREPLFRPPPNTALGRARTAKQTIQVADMLADPGFFDVPPGYSKPQIGRVADARTVLAVPLLKDTQLIGAIVIYRTEVQPVTEKQISLVENFAAQAVIAVENARLLNELRQRTNDLGEALEQQTATSEVLKVISSSPGDLEPVFEAMLENATRMCGAKLGALGLREGDVFRAIATIGASPAFAE